MRQFTSYGPVEIKAHFAVERRELVDRCVEQLIGRPEESGGHYFTIWGPRQTGKTWIMRRAVEEIRARYGERFILGKMSMQGILIDDDAPAETFLKRVSHLFRRAFDMDIEAPRDWEDLARLFERKSGLFRNESLILLIDEFDKLRPDLIDRLVSLFRDMYLNRESYVLHGLALIGVRAVLGVDSPRGSPFNVQRSLHIPNLTQDEVVEMFRQYQSESAQPIEPDVVHAVYESTRGQPGLVGWFGELLTDKYNQVRDKPITMPQWQRVYNKALYFEWNNTLLNLGKKAREPYRAEVLRLFTDPNVPFAMEKPWCSYLYMNGIIDAVPAPEDAARPGEVCRFSSPFVQHRLYSGLTSEMFGDKGPLLAIEIGDELADVFTAQGLCIPPLLERYRGYLKRLKEKGIDPWIGQPRRQDLHYTEAVGHFHLYAWLLNAVGRRCAISPEFPTGNGKVDLVLHTKQHTAVIEVKSFGDMWEVPRMRQQAAAYAKKLRLTTATVVVFAPTQDDAVLAKLASESDEDGVHVHVVPFGWV